MNAHINRRTLLRAGTATGLAAMAAFAASRTEAAARAPGDAPGATTTMEATMTNTVNVVLVHGAFADASSWGRVIPLLQREGCRVVAVQNPLTGLADDIATTRRAIDAAQGPVTLVGHSYGGAVIGAAGNAPNVKALVYVAAFAPDEGESLGELGMRYPALASAKDYRPDAADFLSVDPDAFPQDFAADVDREQARVMAVTQRPVAASVFAAKAGPSAWRRLPAFYQVSEHDGMIHPDMERFFAARMKATTLSLPASHAAMVSHPTEIAQLILDAAMVGATA